MFEGDDIIGGRYDNALDQRRKFAQSLGFFGVITVSVVNTFNAADYMAENSLGMFAWTPARLISERAVRRKSCSRQPFTPDWS